MRSVWSAGSAGHNCWRCTAGCNVGSEVTKMVKQSSANTIHIKGSPRRLATVLRLPERVARATTCTIDLPGVEARRVRIRPIKNTRSQASLLKIKLPDDTPPGVYKGTVHLDDTEFPITVDVEVHHGL